MKRLKALFLLILSVSLFTACKKDNDDKPAPPTPPATIAGTYEGRYGTGNNTPSVFYSFKINANATMEELDVDGKKMGDGIWTITGNTFKTSYNSNFPANSFYSAVGTYDAETKKITGTWGYGNNESNGGKWNMTRK